MEKVTKFLFDWTYHFVKNKDVILKKIVAIQEYINDNYIFVEQKDKNIIYYVVPFIDDIKSVLEKIEKFKTATKGTDSCIITFNSKDNLNKIVEGWEIVNKDPKLSIVFVNPFSLLDKRWIIMPYMHSRITEPESLEPGLNALFDSVDSITKEEISGRISE